MHISSVVAKLKRGSHVPRLQCKEPFLREPDDDRPGGFEQENRAIRQPVRTRQRDRAVAAAICLHVKPMAQNIIAIEDDIFNALSMI
jgi:hypothetical protein